MQDVLVLLCLLKEGEILYTLDNNSGEDHNDNYITESNFNNKIPIMNTSVFNYPKTFFGERSNSCLAAGISSYVR